MPLQVDTLVHGSAPRAPSRAMMLALSDELFNHLREAVIAERNGVPTDGSHLPPPAVELEFTRQQPANEKVHECMGPASAHS